MPAYSVLSRSSSCRRLASAAVIALILGFGGPAHAALLTVSWLDDDDSTDVASPDLLSVTLTFDNTTGDYTVQLFASDLDPFQGALVLVNVILLNVDTGSTSDDPARFLDSGNAFRNIDPPTTLLELTGTDPVLLSWDVGDRVTHCHRTVGCNALFFPPFNQTFVTSVTDDVLFANNSVSIITAAPEPGTGILMAMAAGAILLGSRVRREPGRNR